MIKNKKIKEKYVVFQERLPFWNENLFEQANVLARSSIFTISESKKIEYIDSFSKQFCLGGSDTISYQGLRLNTFDEEILKQLLFYKRGQPLVTPVICTRNALLKNLGKQSNGSYFKKVDNSLSRLLSGELLITSRHALEKLHYLMNQSLKEEMNEKFLSVLNVRFEPYMKQIAYALAKDVDYQITLKLLNRIGTSPIESGNLPYAIELDPMMILLFDGVETTRTSRMLNTILTKPATKRLYQFFLSHNGIPHNMTITSYHGFLGSRIDIEKKAGFRKFKQQMKGWLTDLEKVGAILSGWKIIDNKVCNITATKLDLNTIY